MERTEVIKKIKEFVGEGGLLPFEHGFERPVIKVDDEVCCVTMVSDTLIYYYVLNGINKKPLKKTIGDFSDKALEDVYFAMVEYEQYCLYEA